jgi:hypothetical protein
MAAADTRPDPSPAVDQLLATLARERDALAALDSALTRQFDALRARETPAFETATDDASEAVAALGRLHLARERQVRLLARLLGVGTEGGEVPALAPLADALAPRDRARADALRALRNTLRDAAEAVQRRQQELTFALDVAVRLGHELLAAWQQPDAAGRVYAGDGRARPASARPLLDRVG